MSTSSAVSNTAKPVNGKISAMNPLLNISADVWFSIITLPAAGKPESHRLNLQTLKDQLLLEGKSAYDLALLAGFTGTMDEWLHSLEGKSAYQLAVDAGEFTGTQNQWLQSMQALWAVNSGIEGQVLVAGPDRAIWKQLTKAMVGLDRVDNTSDLEKPISLATQAALDEKASRADIPPAVIDTLTGLGMYLDEEGNLVFDEGQVRGRVTA